MIKYFNLYIHEDQYPPSTQKGIVTKFQSYKSWQRFIQLSKNVHIHTHTHTYSQKNTCTWKDVQFYQTLGSTNQNHNAIDTTPLLIAWP
jgi:hypothetical protein